MGKKTKGQKAQALQAELRRTRVEQAQGAIQKVLKEYNVSLRAQMSYGVSSIGAAVVIVANQGPAG
jgi:hypothetical protein